MPDGPIGPARGDRGDEYSVGCRMAKRLETSPGGPIEPSDPHGRITSAGYNSAFPQAPQDPS
jgi:hypothetical protein